MEIPRGLNPKDLVNTAAALIFAVSAAGNAPVSAAEFPHIATTVTCVDGPAYPGAAMNRHAILDIEGRGLGALPKDSENQYFLYAAVTHPVTRRDADTHGFTPIASGGYTDQGVFNFRVNGYAYPLFQEDSKKAQGEPILFRPGDVVQLMFRSGPMPKKGLPISDLITRSTVELNCATP